MAGLDGNELDGNELLKDVDVWLSTFCVCNFGPVPNSNKPTVQASTSSLWILLNDVASIKESSGSKSFNKGGNGAKVIS